VGEGDRSSGSTEPYTGLGIHSAVDTAPDGTGAVLDPNTGLGAWSVVEPSETYLVQGDIDQPRWGKRPRGFGKVDSDEDEAQDKLRLLKTSNPIPEEMKEAVARCAAKAEADEAASEPVVFKKRKATTSGFRRKL